MSTPELTPTVERTAQQVVEQAKSASHLVIVEGLSGVGKTALVNHITPEIEAKGGIVVPHEQIMQDRINPSEIEGPIVATATVNRNYSRGWLHSAAHRLFPNGEVRTILLRGMPAGETDEFIAKLPEGELSSDLVAYYSMGVPLLARRFVQADSTYAVEARGTEYIRQAARYNPRDLKDLATFLQMAIPIEFLPGRSDAPAGVIYGSLDYAEHEKAELAKAGINEESPQFLAPESERIYNTMLQSEEGPSDIDIFVPHLSPTDFNRIQQALGYDSKATFFSERGEQIGDYRQEKSTRARMFAADFRKASFWFRDEAGAEHEVDNEYSAGAGPIDLKVEGYQEALESGQLGLTSEGINDDSPSMWIHSHEHDGMASHTARFGWMVESLLQQRGIAYFVNNDTADLSYAYLPDERRIITLPDRVKISHW